VRYYCKHRDKNLSRDVTMKLLMPCLLLFLIATAPPLKAAEMVDLKVFSEDDYLRIAISLDQPAKTKVEANAEENLVFIRFDSTGVGLLARQSFLYPENPHLESITLLPLGRGSTVARVKARHPFKVKTYEITEPPRFVLELNDVGRTIGSTSKANPPQGLDYYRRGLQQMQAHSYKAALMSLRSAIRTGNRTSDSYYHAGVIRYKLNQLDKALINFSRAKTSSLYGDEARLYLSWIHYKNGNYPAMRGAWRRFAERLPERSARISLARKHPEIDYRALESATEGTIDKAGLNAPGASPPGDSRIETLQTGVDRDSAACYFDRAMVLKADGRLEQAAGDLENAVRCDPQYSQAYFQLGVIYKSLGKSALSAASFEKSLGMRRSPGQFVGERIEFNKTSGRTFPEPEVSAASAETDNAVSKQDLPAAVPAVVSWKTGPGKTALASSSALLPGAGEQSAEGVTAGGSGSMLGTARSTAREVISLARSGLLRKQIWLLTLITGLLFALTLLGERFFLGRLFRRKNPAAGKTGGVVDLYPKGSSNQNRKTMVISDKRPFNPQEQLAHALAGAHPAGPQAGITAQAEDNYHRPAAYQEPAGTESLQLRLNPAPTGGIYGEDIARRIKEELSKTRLAGKQNSMAGSFGNGGNDVQTRLIRQLRSKSWSISDIAQEMNLSREEVKWALAASPTEEPSAQKLNGEIRHAQYGQARTLLKDGMDPDFQRVAEKMDREADLELQINL